MRKFSVIITIILMLVVATTVLAQTSLPGSGWWSGETIQNVGNDTATISVNAFGDGCPATGCAVTKDVDPGAFTNFMPGDFSDMPSGFQGAALVSSNQPIKAIVNVTNRETRVALLEDGTIAELFVDRGDDSNIAGNIYKGRVVRVLPGMQAAFVDIGLIKPPLSMWMMCFVMTTENICVYLKLNRRSRISTLKKT